MTAAVTLDINQIRKDFPLLGIQMNGKPLVYLDNAATTQKPRAVIDRMTNFLKQEYATVHRGVYSISQLATEECERVRSQCRQFLNASKSSEIIFVRGATEAVNLVAYSYGRTFVREGDEILLSAMEHHANIVPWQQLCQATGAVVKVIPMNERGELILEAYSKLLNKRTKIVAVNHISNALGTINPVKEITGLAHEAGAVVFIDGAQSAAHMPVDVRALGADFYCFSGHKVYGPTGIGVLYGRQDLLEKMNPYQTGGEMIESVSFEKTTFAKSPAKFEAGTPAITEIIGMGAALEYLQQVGFSGIQRWENELLEIATQKLLTLPGLRIIGQAAHKASLISFELGDIHPHDIGTILDQEGIAIRTGHHCAQPVMQFFKVPATARASFSFYNTREEIDRLIEGLHKVIEVFS